MHCGMFTSIPSLHPLEASKKPPLPTHPLTPIMTNKKKYLQTYCLLGDKTSLPPPVRATGIGNHVIFKDVKGIRQTLGVIYYKLLFTGWENQG